MTVLRLLCVLLVGVLTVVSAAAKGSLEVMTPDTEPIVFPETTVGATSTVVVTLYNTSSYNPVTVTNLYFDGPQDGFSYEPLPLPVEVGPYGTLQLTIYFSPQAAGVHQAELKVQFDEAGEIGLEESLHVQGTCAYPTPDLRVWPAVLDFGTVTTTAVFSGAVTVSNQYGQSAGTITGIAVPAGSAFAYSGQQPPIVVNAGYDRSLTFTFSPTAEGTYETTATIYTDDGIFEVLLRGVLDYPAKPDLEVWPAVLDFGTVTTATVLSGEVTVSNQNGESAGTVTELVVPEGSGFAYAGPLLPLGVEAGYAEHLTFTFSPTAEGAYETTATIYTDDGIFEVLLRGTLAVPTAPDLRVWPAVLDFGTVTTATVFADEVTISNQTGTAAGTITGVVVPAGSGFAYSGPQPPVVVNAGYDRPLTFTFGPMAEGTYETTATIYTDDGTFDVLLRGTLDLPASIPVLTAAVTTTVITARVGEEFVLPVIAAQLSADASVLVASCRVVLRFNATLAALRMPVDGLDSIGGGMRTVAVRAPLTAPREGDVLFSIPMTAALGDAEATAIDLLEVQWFDAAGAPLDVQTTTGYGRLIIGDIWRYGEVRLVNSNAGGLAMDILPNPVRDRATFRLAYRTAASLIVCDVMGNTLLSLSDALPRPGPNPVALQVDVSNLPTGTYYCRLSSGKFSLVRTLRVE